MIQNSVVVVVIVFIPSFFNFSLHLQHKLSSYKLQWLSCRNKNNATICYNFMPKSRGLRFQCHSTFTCFFKVSAFYTQAFYKIHKLEWVLTRNNNRNVTSTCLPIIPTVWLVFLRKNPKFSKELQKKKIQLFVQNFAKQFVDIF